MSDGPRSENSPAGSGGTAGMLARLRRRRGVSQVELARRMAVSQPHIARLEQQSDMLLSTLARHIAALGGQLELIVSFPGGEVTTLEKFKSQGQGASPIPANGSSRA